MRKITLLLVAIAISFATYAVGMSGTYKVGTTETAPNFTSLKAAIDGIKSNGVAGNIVLEITSDLTEPANIGFGVNTAGNSILIRPDADIDRTITFTQSADNGASSGAIVFGLSDVASWASLVSTSNITIDGYAVGGSTKRLTIATASTANANATPIHIIGDVNNVTIRNCKLTINQSTGSSAFGAVAIRAGNWGSVDYLADDITVENCVINTNTPSGAGISTSNTTSNSGAVPTGRPTGLIFRNNVITVKHRAISLNYSGTCSIYNNEIRVNQTASGMASFAIGGTSSGLVTTNVYNNKIIQLGTANTAGGANGIRGIQASAGGTWNIYNNFITGFSTPATGTTEALGIRAGSTSNIYNNTIVLNNITTTGAGTSPIGCVVNYATTCNLANNILITQEDDIASYCIYQSGTLTTSDYNVFYRTGTVNAKTGYAAGLARATLSDWQTASTKDKLSKSVEVNFTNSTTGDLSLAGASVGDWQLAVPKLVTVTTDIDGTNRAALTYAGADEAATDLTTLAKQFTVTVPNGTTKVYAAGSFTGKNWDNATPFELMPTGVANQFSGILPCVDGVEYKYLCEMGDWDYEEGRYNPVNGGDPLKLAANRTYNAADNVVLWYRANKITLNVSFDAATPVPTQLFVKGSFNGWTTGLELTKSGNTFSKVLGGNPGDKYPANTEYKYFTNDINAENWESDASGLAINNRWSISPVMNDVVARFTTMLTTNLDDIKSSARIIRTMSGIEVQLNSEANIELYTINGVLIDKTRIEGTYARDLNNGIYIIRIDGKATKFVK